MSASIYGNVGGVSRKAKELYAKVNGVNRKIKGEYAKVNGVVRKVYSGYQCQIENTRYCTVSENGAISYTLPGDIDEHDLFHIHFKEAQTFAGSGSIKIYSLKIIESTINGPPVEDFNIWSEDWSVNTIGGEVDTISDIPQTVNCIFKVTGSYQDLYFTGGHNIIMPVTGSAPSGSLYINGEQITSVELI